MAQSKLNVLLGLDISGFERSIARASNKMEQLSKKFTSVGTTLSIGFTAPFAILAKTAADAFNVQAKAIAQVEAGLKSTGDSFNFTSQQLQKFASDLQSNSLFGDEEILTKVTSQFLTFGNIADENFNRAQQAALDLATRLDGDLQGAAIQLGKALQDPVKGINALSRSGVSFSDEQKALIKQLVSTGRAADAQRIILSELEKQYGGSAAAAAAAGTGPFKQAEMAFGDLLEVIGKVVVEALTPLALTLKGLFERLQSVNPVVLKVALGFGALLAAAGPLLLTAGSILKVIPLLVSGFTLLTGPIGLIVIGLTALVVALVSTSKSFQDYNKEASKAAAVQGKLAEVSKEAQQRAADQKTEVDILVNALKKENLSYEEKQRILNELKTISPEYFGNLKNTATAAIDAEAAQKGFNDELLRTIQIEVAREKLKELEKQLQNVREESKPSVWQLFVNALKSGGAVTTNAALNMQTYGQNVANTTEEIKAQQQALLDLINEQKKPPPKTGGGGGGGGAVAAGPTIDVKAQKAVFADLEKTVNSFYSDKTAARIEAWNKRVFITFTTLKKEGQRAIRGVVTALAEVNQADGPIKETEKALKAYADAIGIAEAKARIFGTDAQTLLAEQLGITKTQLEQSIEKFGENSVVVEELTEKYNDLGESLRVIQERQELIAKYQSTFASAFNTAAGIINQSGLSIKTVMQSVAQAVRAAVTEVVRGEIAKAVAAWIADSFTKFGILGAAVAAAGGAVVGSIFTGAINAIVPPRLAQGGLATKETLAVVGDNPSGKEAIIPFERMGEFLDMAGGGAMRLVGQFEVRGQDLVLVLDRATQQKLRVR